MVLWAVHRFGQALPLEHLRVQRLEVLVPKSHMQQEMGAATTSSHFLNPLLFGWVMLLFGTCDVFALFTLENLLSASLKT